MLLATPLNYGKFEMVTAAFAEMLGFARKPLNKIRMFHSPILGDSKSEKRLLTKMEELYIYFINRSTLFSRSY